MPALKSKMIRLVQGRKCGRPLPLSAEGFKGVVATAAGLCRAQARVPLASAAAAAAASPLLTPPPAFAPARLIGGRSEVNPHKG